MSEKFESEKKSKTFSEDDVTKIQNLVRKMREMVSWDLAKYCSNEEEESMVENAKHAMEDIEHLFHVPEWKPWVTFDGNDMYESIQKAEIYNNQILPSEKIMLSSNDLQNLRSNLEAIALVVGWDIAEDDETLMYIREARESLEALKKFL